MCTVCVWAKEGQPTLSARNMDWALPMDTDLWVFPAGQHHRAGPDSEKNVMEWTSKFGSVAASSYNMGTAGGLNSAGLAASALWLSESTYGVRDPEIPMMGIAFWVQYYLDNFALVAEAVQDFKDREYQVVTADITPGRTTTVHIQIADVQGNVAVFEVVDGQFTIHEGKQYPVLTNSPAFSEQLENVKKYVGFGGDLPLPGGTDAEARFVRASYYREMLPEAPTADAAVAEILSVARNVAQPWGTPDPERPNISKTIWTTISDHTNLRYYFQATSSPYPVWLDFANLDLSEGAPIKVLKLDYSERQLGEQSGALVDHAMLPFTTE